MEAGIEEALTHLNRNDLTNILSDGWTLSGTRYRMERVLDDCRYIVFIEPNNGKPVIECEGFTPLLMARSSGNGSTFATISDTQTRSVDYVRRKVRVTAYRDALLSKAMAADGTINMNGNNVTTDGFDSMDPKFSTNGQYDSSKRKASGDVATNFDILNQNGISAGNANIYGTVSTGPGATVTLGTNGKVGDTAWHADTSKTGIQPGWSSDDMNVNFDPVEEPFATELPPLPGIIGGVVYTHVLTNGNYMIAAGNFGGKVLVTGNATLYVTRTASVAFSGNDFIKIDPNASLKLYVGSTSASIGGNGVLNQSGSALNFQYYGLPSNTSLALGGNAEFRGTIYAPNADFTLSGGGNTVTDFIGSSITKTVKMDGKFNFHYDEALRRVGPSRGYIVTSWQEI
jgi:hypothetical protein